MNTVGPAQSCSPLSWPQWWAQRSRWVDFLVGMPLIGPGRRLRKSIWRQLSARHDVILNAWEPSERNVARKVSSVIQECLGWPNAFFVPDDPLEILLFDAGDSMSAVEAMVEIEERLGVEMKCEESLGDLVNRIVSHSV